MVVARETVPSKRAAAPAEVADGAPRREMDAARARFYLLLANLLARSPSVALLGELAELKGDASPLGMALVSLAEAADGADAQAIGREHFQLFIGIGRGDVLPFASYYLTGFLHERPLARVREDMARLGIERREGVFEPEDHISSLFEVMAGLIGGELGSEADEADKFFTRHIAPWAPRLMADVAVAQSARFYRHVGELGRIWVDLEMQAQLLSPRCGT